MSIASYRARQFREMFANNGENKLNDDRIVFDIIKKADGDLKREEIVHAFANKVDLDYEDASQVVSGCLTKLVKAGCIERVQHGHYKFVRQGE